MPSVTSINAFEVPVGREDEFVERWAEVNAYVRRQPGYLSHRLYRCQASDARYRFVNVATWESETHWRDAHDDGFRRLVEQPVWADFPALPGLYEIVHEGQAHG